jgi:large subunit ribosomal protein L35
MPKLKTRKSVAKRFKRTAGGKIKRTCAGRGHLFTGKSRKRKRQLRKGALVSSADLKRVSNALVY